LSSKKQKNNSKNKENVVEIIEIDENSRFEEQKKMNDLAQEMLTIQRQKNEELEREIMLLEKRNQMLGL
jgi:hypothetical protein